MINKYFVLLKRISTLLAILFIFLPGTLSAADQHSTLISLPSGDLWSIPSVSSHSIFLCVMLILFPRITLAFLALGTGSIGITLLGLLGWIFIPRILIAIMATLLYWPAYPILVILAWLIAILCEASEKVVFQRRVVYRYRRRGD